MANINLFDLVRLIDDRIKYALLKFRTGSTDASPSPRPVPHGFFSLTHTDTVPGSPARGQIVRANGTPAWESFYANTLGYMVQGNGVDVVSAPFNWDTIAGAYGAYMVHDHSSAMYGGPVAGGVGGHIIQDEGVSLTQRSRLNFVGSGVSATDDAGNDATVVTIQMQLWRIWAGV
jgi:hypothetical protein